MAYEAIRPHQAQILALIDQGRTYAQVVDALQTMHGVKTTTATLSRFLAEVRPERGQRPATPPPPPTQPPYAQPYPPSYYPPGLETVLAEVRAGREENHSIQQVIAGKVAALSADIVELEKAIVTLQEQQSSLVTLVEKPAAVAPPPLVAKTVTPRTLTRIWVSAAVITFLLWAAIIGLIIAAVVGR